MSLDQILAVVVIILFVFSLVSSVRRDLKEVGRLRFRWIDLNMLGLVFLIISSALRNPATPWEGIHYFLTIIGCLCVLVAVIGLSMNRNKQ